LGCADRPANLYIPDWLENMTLAVDITAVAAHRGEGKEHRGEVGEESWARQKGRRKNGIAKSSRIPKYQCRLFPLLYHPSVSSFGSKKAKDLLTYLAVTIADHELISPHVVRQHIVRQIVSAVMRSVADAISATLDQRGFEEREREREREREF